MRILLRIDSSFLDLAILRAAALLAPGPQRAEWFAEWRSELWYVRERRHRESHLKPAAIVFCLGAFQDALWLRRNNPSPNARRFACLESPFHCVLLLAVLAAVSVFFAFRLPAPRDAILPSPYRDAHNLVMISRDGHFAGPVPTVSIEDYRSLTNHAQSLFTGLAFYQPMLARAHTARRGTVELSIALASGNLFELLDAPLSSPAPEGRQHTPGLVLSDAAWRKHFDGDSRIAGQLLEIAGKQARVAGVISERSWRLPGRPDAWLLVDEQGLPPRAKGFVLGRVRASAFHPRRNWRSRISVPNRQGGYDTFECASLVHPERILAQFLLIAVALLILPATTSLALGEYPATACSPRRATRCRRWIFLAVKFALLLPIVFCGTLDLGPIISAGGIQPHATLVGYVLAFRWALTDQRQRCPVCLRLLTNPIRIGQPSQTFLALYGTELMCVKGHGLLHVPEIPTSYSAQRWTYLDPSWSSLFS